MDSPQITFQAPIEGYAGQLSYEPSDVLTVHCRSTVDRFGIEIARVGRRREVVWHAEGIAGALHPIPDDAASRGARWPAAATLEIPDTWKSGFYEIVFKPEGAGADDRHSPACFVLRGSPNGERKPILLVLATNTYNAYNDWGGSSLYTGGVRVSFERPLAPGFLNRPSGGLLREATAPGVYDPELSWQHDFIHEHGLSGWCAAAGWCNWEERFVRWAEEYGYEFDYAVNADLDFRPEVLTDRRLVLSVGHDEYWSWNMRDTLESFIAQGGNVAFFSGNNVCWQVRFEDDGRAMVSYKYDAPGRDPMAGGEQRHLLTSLWSDQLIGRPENELTGVSMSYGGYVRIGHGVPRGSGGYTVWRPEHWVFDRTGLRYGDLLGAEHVTVGYEADGCDMALDETGLPVPTHRDGTPETFQILASSPARLWSQTPEETEFPASLKIPADEPGDLQFTASRVFGDASPEHVSRVAHGNAVMGVYTNGGTVFTTGCTDWAYGLAGGDELVERVTHNVLGHLGSPAGSHR